VVGGDAVAHDRRRGRRRAVSGGRLGGGHGSTTAYPGSGEGDGVLARSDKRGRKRSDSFGHGLSGRRVRRGERPGCREWHGLSGWAGGGWNADTARPDSAFMVRRACDRGRVAATWRRHADRRARCGKRWLTGGSLMSAIFELKFTPGPK
jgi:hypothetical protein